MGSLLRDFDQFLRRDSVLVALGAFALALAGFEFIRALTTTIVGAIQTSIPGDELLRDVEGPLRFAVNGHFVDLAGIVATLAALLIVALVVALLARRARGQA